MADDFEDVNFAHDPSDVGLVLDLVLLEDLDGDFLLGELVSAFSHLAKRTRSDRFTCW